MKTNNNALALICLGLALNKQVSDFEVIDSHVDEEGFYLDFATSDKFDDAKFNSLTKAMQRIIAGAYEITSNGKDLVANSVTFKNLSLKECNNTKFLKSFILNSIGGVEVKHKNNCYRIHGNGFANDDEKVKFIEYQNELKSRDHRTLGSELKIFTFDELAGQGLPIFLPNGAFLKEQISSYLKKTMFKYNFEMVSTPVLGSKQLYVTSGHWDLYKDNNFPPIKVDGEEFMLRPMTCPHHMLVYKSSPRSYKELPIKYFEDAKLHRYESSGGLIGLERVRAMELFDTHIFVRKDQIKDMVFLLNSLIKEVYEKLGIKIDRVDLSLRSKDKAKFFDDDKMWEESQSMLREMLQELKYDFYEMDGEAAFYGPKIDFQYKTVLGKYITISTIQLDFLLPRRFELTYKDADGKDQIPVLIHLGIIGTYERFISALLSQTKGNLPFWLQRTQIEIIPVNNNFHLEFAKKVETQLRNEDLRVTLNDSDERMSKKIMNSQKSKVRFQLIIGDDEVKNNQVSVRRYGENASKTMGVQEFINICKKEK